MTSESDAPQEAYVWIWLPGETEPVVAGRIEKAENRYLFNYGRSYLANPDRIAISLPELPLRKGQIEPQPPLEIANSLRDASPDAWGRRVIINRLTGLKGDEAHTVDLDELTYMLHSGSDRIGALDFQPSATEYVPREAGNASLDDLQASADMVEEGIPLTPTLAEVLEHGTAIGGARPKALLEADGTKYIAKFSSSNDSFNVIKGEFVAMRLAALSGISVAPVHLTTALGKDVLLVERFDRVRVATGWHRRASVSALTLLELDEIMAAHASYLVFAGIIRKRFKEPKATLRELFSRMCYNILVGNTDDHARNHAAFWDGSDLSLTPAYDICPQSRSGREASQAMLITGTVRRSQLSNCLIAANEFLLNAEDALAIMRHQIETIRQSWATVCDQANLSEIDQRYFWRRQFLNGLSFEGIEEELGVAIEGIG